MRLGVGTAAPTSKPPKMFQFQLGAIGRMDEKTVFYKKNVFQFQLGAIGRKLRRIFTLRHLKFQFQLGAIGRQQFSLIELAKR